jgi:hypothetical protein
MKFQEKKSRQKIYFWDSRVFFHGNKFVNRVDGRSPATELEQQNLGNRYRRDAIGYTLLYLLQ